jgi:glycosyltransferase involved in cell wall biosynthesis
MPRILVLFEFSTLNGGENSWLACLPDVLAAGMEVVAAAPPGGRLGAVMHPRGVPLVPLQLLARQRSQGERRALLAERLESVRPDLVHANSLAMSRLAGPVVQFLGIPSLGHLRDIVRLSAAAVADVNCHTRLLAVSQATRDWHLAQGMAAEKTVVLYNGVDLERFRPRRPSGDLHRQLDLPPAAALVGAVGQLGCRKGLDVVVQAFRDLARQRPEAHLVLVGIRYSRKAESVRFEAELRGAASQDLLAGRVHFLGWRDDIPHILPELTMLVHAARQEPLGRVLLEAAACGVPVVATRVGGTEEIFPGDPPRGALLVSPGDAESLAAQMARLLQSPELARRLGRVARQRVVEAFSSGQAGRLLVQQYRALLAGEG